MDCPANFALLFKLHRNNIHKDDCSMKIIRTLANSAKMLWSLSPESLVHETQNEHAIAYK